MGLGLCEHASEMRGERRCQREIATSPITPEHFQAFPARSRLMSLPRALYNLGASVPKSQFKVITLGAVVGTFAFAYAYTSTSVKDRTWVDVVGRDGAVLAASGRACGAVVPSAGPGRGVCGATRACAGGMGGGQARSGSFFPCGCLFGLCVCAL